MRTLAVFLMAVLLAISGVAFAEQHSEAVVAKDDAKTPEVWCPVTRYTDNSKCSECHVMVKDGDGLPKFGLKEIPIDASYSEKPYEMSIVQENNELIAYVLVDNINAALFRNVSQYLYIHPEIRKLVVEIHSPGGSVMAAWRIVGIIEEMRAHGIVVETRCYGLAASAGGILLIAGDLGSRFVAPHSEIMLHKVWQFAMFDVSDPDSAEDKADVLKHFQANINKFFEERTNLSSDIINEKSYHKMWWFTGKEAIEHGVADGLIGLQASFADKTGVAAE